jgi:hypothetical protein
MRPQLYLKRWLEHTLFLTTGNTLSKKKVWDGNREQEPTADNWRGVSNRFVSKQFNRWFYPFSAASPFTERLFAFKLGVDKPYSI